MAGWARTGTFIQRATTGTQSITGLPGQPDFVLFWTHGNEALDSWEADGRWGDTPSEGIRRSVGFWSSAGTLTQAALSDALGFNATVTDTRQVLNTAAVGIMVSHINIITDGIAWSSADANGFTVNVAVASGRQYIWHYLAIGGDDVRAYAIAINTVASSTTPITVTIPSSPFQPKAALLLGMGHTGSNSSSYGIGALAENGGQWAGSATFNDGQATGSQRRAQTDAGVFSVLSTGTGNLEGYLSLGSINSDGITFNVGNDFSGARSAIVLMLGGADILEVAAGTSAKPTGSAPASQAVSGLGFKPNALFAVSLGMPTQGVTSGDDVANALWSIGAADRDAQNVSAMRFAEASANYQGAYADDDALVVHGDEAGATNSTRAKAVLSSFDADGFTLSWTTNDAAADLLHYLALRMNEADPPEEVIAERELLYALRELASFPRDLAWNLSEAEMKSLAVEWATRSADAAERELAWRLFEAQSAERVALWNALREEEKQRVSVWMTRLRDEEAKPLQWSLSASVAQELDALWSLRLQDARAVEASFSVREEREEARELAWDLRATEEDTLLLSWVARVAAEEERSAEWSVRLRPTATRGLAWSVRSADALARSIIAAIRERRGAEREAAWALRLRSAAARPMAWSVRASAATAREILAAVRLRAQESRAVVWNVEQLATVLLRSVQWATRAERETQPELGWSVRRTLAESRALAWIVRARVALSRISAWTARDFVIRSRVARFDIRARAEASRAVEWAQRRSASRTQTVEWSLRSAVALARVARFSVRRSAQREAAAEWLIRGFATRTRTARWMLRVRDGALRILRWDTRTGLAPWIDEPTYVALESSNHSRVALDGSAQTYVVTADRNRTTTGVE